MDLEDLIDLTGEAQTRDVDETGEEVPETKDYEEDEDDFDQAHLTEYFRKEYEDTGGSVSMADLVYNHFERLLHLSTEDIKHFKRDGTYTKINRLVAEIDRWTELNEGGSRYRRVAEQILTDENLELLQDALATEAENLETAEQREVRQRKKDRLAEKKQDEELRELMSKKENLSKSVPKSVEQFAKLPPEQLYSAKDQMLGDVLRQRFKFIFDEVAHTEADNFEGHEKQFQVMNSVFDKYNARIPSGPPAFGHYVGDVAPKKGISVYNWVGGLTNPRNDSATIKNLRGTPEQFVAMYKYLEHFEHEWRSESDKLKVDWDSVWYKGHKTKPKPPPKKAAKPPPKKAKKNAAEILDILSSQLGGFAPEITKLGYELLESTQKSATEPRVRDMLLKQAKKNYGFDSLKPEFFARLIMKTLVASENKDDPTKFLQDRINLVRGEPEKKSTEKSTEPPYERNPQGLASVQRKIKSSEGFQKTLVDFLWSENTAKVLATADPKATETLLHKFYVIWKNYFPDLKVLPADWPKQSAQALRARTSTVLDDNLFYGKMRGLARATIKTQKALAKDNASKIYKGKTRRPAFLRFVELLQDRKRYLEWAGVGKEPGKPPPPEKPQGKQPKDLRAHVEKVADDWIQDGLHHMERFGPVGVKLARIPTAVARSNLNAQKGIPHYQIVQSVTNYLGVDSRGNGQLLLQKLLEDTGTGDDEPQHQWSWHNVVTRYGEGASAEWASTLNRMFTHYVVTKVVKEVGNRLELGTFPNSEEERRAVAAFSPAEEEMYLIGKNRKPPSATGDEEKEGPPPQHMNPGEAGLYMREYGGLKTGDPASEAREYANKIIMEAFPDLGQFDVGAITTPVLQSIINHREGWTREFESTLQREGPFTNQIFAPFVGQANAKAWIRRLETSQMYRTLAGLPDEERSKPDPRIAEHEERVRAHQARKNEYAKMEQEHSMATAARRKGLYHATKIEEQLQAIQHLRMKIADPQNQHERDNKEQYERAVQRRRELIRELQDQSAPDAKRPKTFDVNTPKVSPELLPSLPRSPSPSPEPPDIGDRGRSPSPGPGRLSVAKPRPERSRQRSPSPRRPGRARDLSVAKPRPQRPRRRVSRSVSPPPPHHRTGLARPRSRPLQTGMRPPRAARPDHASQVSFQVSGVQRISASQRRQPMPPVRPRPRPMQQAPPANMQQAAPQQIFAGPPQLSQAQQDVLDRNAALAALRNHPRFRPEFEKNFEYDPNTRTYKEKRRAYYSYTPITKTYVGGYQLQAVHQEEVAYVRAKHPDLETFKRNDVYDVARKFNRAAKKRPIDGRARQYLNVGPWLRLRLLKTSVHITRKGTPPQKAYAILAKHLLKQIQQAVKPRIVAPNFKGGNKQFMTIGTTEALKNATPTRLTQLLEKGLRRKPKHIIYRQTNRGGPLMEYAKKNEALY